MLTPEVRELTTLAAAVAASLILFLNWRALQQAIERFSDTFRGGPPSGPLPAPGDDGAMVLRRRRPPTSDERAA